MTFGPASTGAPRAVGTRGAVVGAVCGLGGVLAHASSAPGPIGLLTPAVVAVVGLALGPLLVLRPSLPRLLGGALVVQLLAHLSMALGAMPAGHGPGHGSTASPLSVVVTMVLDGGVPMLAAHLAIATATALLARGADRALVSLVREWLEALVLPEPASSPVPRCGRSPVAAPRTRPLARQHRRAAGPRAPPGRRSTSAVPA